MPEPLWGAAAICLGWGLFGAVHSLLCRAWVKRPAERFFGPAFLAGLYRPLYVVISTALILWLWLFPLGLPGDIIFFSLPEAIHLLPVAVKGAAVALIAVCFRKISFAEFTGIGQLARWFLGRLKDLSSTRPDELPMAHEDEPLAVQGVYLWVRHPLNTAAFVWIWVQPSYTLYNVTFALCLTAYILIGNRFEERDLIERYGAAYEKYREIVPAFFGGFSGLAARREKLRKQPG